MKFIALFAFITITAAAFDSKLDKKWAHFKKKFNKNYDDKEEAARRQIFEERMANITQHNGRADKGHHKYKRGLNQYSDVNHDEFVKHFNGFRSKGVKNRSGRPFLSALHVKIPDTIDWVQKGLVTPVKNQLQCGSCWAFSTTGALEGQHMKKTGQLVILSEQNLVDCDTANMGCLGGDMDSAFAYIKNNSGIDTEDSYPYKAENGGTCLFNKATVGATCTGIIDIPSGDEDALKQAVGTVGPVSVAIDASHPSFQSYESGIYDEPDCSSDNLDHGVLVVGYGTENGNDYWLVKNSYGPTWGMNGYIMMQRNNNNHCGIATEAQYPLV